MCVFPRMSFDPGVEKGGGSGGPLSGYGIQSFCEDLFQKFWIGLSLGCLHGQPHQESCHLCISSPEVLNVGRMFSDDPVNHCFKFSGIGDLAEVTLFHYLFRCFLA